MPGMGGGNEDEVETHNAEELTDETFEERLQETELLMVFFREGVGGHKTKQMDKEVELAATELAGDESAIAIGMVDLQAAKKAAKKAGVTEGPVFKVFRRGKPIKLGPPGADARSLVNFMRYLTSPVSKQLASTAEVNEFLRNAMDTVVLGIFADATRPSHNVWIKSAEALRPPYKFAEASVESVRATKLFAAADLDLTKNQYAVVLPSKWVGKEEAAYHLASDFRAMADFVPAHADARIGPFTSHRRAKMLKRGQANVVLSLDLERRGKMFKYVLNRLHRLLDSEPRLEQHFSFTILDTKHTAPMADDFGVPTGSDFAVSVTNMSTLDMWGSDVLVNQSIDAFSALPVAPFLLRVAAGEETPFVKSAPAPSPPIAPAGQISAAVASTFAEVVEDPTTDVLVTLYFHDGKPSDPRRRDGSEEVEKALSALPDLAAMFARVPHFRVVHMNATGNFFHGRRYRMQQMATAFFVPASAAGAERPIGFEDQRVDTLALAEFCLKHLASEAALASEALAAVRKDVRKARKAKEAEAQEYFGGMLGDKEKKKKKKKKKKKPAGGAAKACPKPRACPQPAPPLACPEPRACLAPPVFGRCLCTVTPKVRKLSPGLPPPSAATTGSAPPLPRLKSRSLARACAARFAHLRAHHRRQRTRCKWLWWPGAVRALRVCCAACKGGAHRVPWACRSDAHDDERSAVPPPTLPLRVAYLRACQTSCQTAQIERPYAQCRSPRPVTNPTQYD